MVHAVSQCKGSAPLLHHCGRQAGKQAGPRVHERSGVANCSTNDSSPTSVTTTVEDLCRPFLKEPACDGHVQEEYEVRHICMTPANEAASEFLAPKTVAGGARAWWR
ncbi:hypothetical protein MPTK1_8g05030 [Marchantia polymorpha subsp. ruderalis]|uniref:Uncharacterized protein n=1 Tax=Marchantia polymorpha TaxID=3197 RepID=A0A2R6WKC6_MARPO|nr:hypothetical protein MARPO_0081s0004 [Marchantia polymorpha]BBN18735.1 hypothetical protein Mp_8g05030 [Marchantia polymorpha subsp. ruderalis]|eukprot:PTQ34273.1 hypothetical protein MARPO_0081s0004 [Marchantia polymorpha]